MAAGNGENFAVSLNGSRLEEQLHVAGPLGHNKAHHDQIQHRDDNIAEDGAHRGALNVDLRVPHQEEVGHHLHDAPDEHGADGDLGQTVGLQDGVGQEHDAHEHRGDA